MTNFNTNTENKDEWLTPPSLIKALGEFDLDPAAPIKRPWDMAKTHFTKLDNGLLKEWNGRIWLNPPYGKETFRWAARLSEHKSGILLIFARTDTIGFHEQILNKAHSIFFLRGRIRFYDVNGIEGQMPNAASCLVSYSEEDSKAIEQALRGGQIKGKQVFL